MNKFLAELHSICVSVLQYHTTTQQSPHW